ncbi:hypothetical protein [Alteromonas sp. M12]|uniref:hypothetical protein n=1 Tax=Alteromonas sp. M12 TaxID=3135644 RepID=UPI00319E51F6
MSSYTDDMTEKEWEEFCEKMLRYHYGQSNFWAVPDKDSGDFGIEFYTADGTIFQCYYPDLSVDMKKYKQKIQKKINDDLKKLKEYEQGIGQILGDIKIKQWVLLTQELKSKDLLAYCNKKKKETLVGKISYIDGKNFQVKIETADSFPEGKLFAQNMCLKTIDIPLWEVTDTDRLLWKGGNAEFSENIVRKSNVMMGADSDKFQDRILTKYIQIDKFLDQLREDHPDLHNQIEDSARAQLESMQDESILESDFDKEFVKKIVGNNKEAFEKYSKYFSDNNKQSLSFGFLSKWIAECYMDFVNE